MPILGDILELRKPWRSQQQEIYLTPDVIDYRIDSMIKSLLYEQRKLLTYFDQSLRKNAHFTI